MFTLLMLYVAFTPGRGEPMLSTMVVPGFKDEQTCATYSLVIKEQMPNPNATICAKDRLTKQEIQQIINMLVAKHKLRQEQQEQENTTTQTTRG